MVMIRHIMKVRFICLLTFFIASPFMAMERHVIPGGNCSRLVGQPRDITAANRIRDKAMKNLQPQLDEVHDQLSPYHAHQTAQVQAFMRRLMTTAAPENEWAILGPFGDNALTVGLPVVSYRREDRVTIREELNVGKIKREVGKGLRLAARGKTDSINNTVGPDVMIRNLIRGEYGVYEAACERLTKHEAKLQRRRIAALDDSDEARLVESDRAYVRAIRTSLLAKISDLHVNAILPVSQMVPAGMTLRLVKDALTAEGTKFKSFEMEIPKRFVSSGEMLSLKVSLKTEAIEIEGNPNRKSAIGFVINQLVKSLAKEGAAPRIVFCPEWLAQNPDQARLDFEGTFYVGPDLFLAELGPDFRLVSQKALYRNMVRERAGGRNAFRGKFSTMTETLTEGKFSLFESSLYGRLVSPYLIREMRKHIVRLQSHRARRALVRSLSSVLGQDRETFSQHREYLRQLESRLESILETFRAVNRDFRAWRVESHALATTAHRHVGLQFGETSLLIPDFPPMLIGAYQTGDFHYVRVALSEETGTLFEFPGYGNDVAGLFKVLLPLLDAPAEHMELLSPHQAEALWKLIHVLRRQIDVYEGITDYLDAEYDRMIAAFTRFENSDGKDKALAAVFAELESFEMPAVTRVTRRTRSPVKMSTALVRVISDAVETKLFTTENLARLAELPTMSPRSAKYRTALEEIGTEAFTVAAENAGYRVIPRKDDHEGFDILIERPGDERTLHVELKSTLDLAGTLSMSAAEINFAREHEKDWAIAVAHIRADGTIGIYLRRNIELGNPLRGTGKSRPFLIEEDILSAEIVRF